MLDGSMSVQQVAARLNYTGKTRGFGLVDDCVYQRMRALLECDWSAHTNRAYQTHAQKPHRTILGSDNLARQSHVSCTIHAICSGLDSYICRCHDASCTTQAPTPVRDAQSLLIAITMTFDPPPEYGDNTGDIDSKMEKLHLMMNDDDGKDKLIIGLVGGG